jgi:alpha-glucosidase (family GH31 glycosyl hydrolase)
MSPRPEDEGSGVPYDTLWINDPEHDPYTFVKAEKFFKSKSSFNKPWKVVTREETPTLDITKTGAVFRFNDNKLLLIQFIRPKVWKIRFDATNEKPSDYKDYNSRTIICDTLTELRQLLDGYSDGGSYWTVKHSSEEESKERYCMQSVQYGTKADMENDRNGTVVVNLYIERAPFRMIAVRLLEHANKSDDETIARLAGELSAEHRMTEKIIWETTSKPLRWKQFGDTTATILTVKKPGSSKYIGFGEQGGKSLLKNRTFMNYFDYDNMMYNGVYGKGPLDEREPLYHSEPFWMELNTHQNMRSKTATFIDNYSQICIDFAKTNGGKIRTGTRFGALHYYVIAGDDIPEIIQYYTSMIGRPKLKPRYILGHHQGCYGYDTEQKVLDRANQYRERNFPLDGIHIDVDLQDEYRTFTTSPQNFPNAQQMFKTLREKGIKCSTNITPVIKNSDTADKTYKTFQTGMQKGFFVKDIRKPDNLLVSAADVRYIKYEGGTRIRMDPSADVNALALGGENFWDPGYSFANCYNSRKEYHGGVHYGMGFGTPGFYPDLNRKEVREWWGQQYEDLFKKGLEFVWQDMTTPAVSPSYGDMKGFPFRLMLSSDAWSREGDPDAKKTAIEIWSLYSYNLHKATYRGLSELPTRKGKRNFIIGRGSFAGMHRYAGLWTGDNASTWDHFKISVSQVLASGLSGVSITGADVGGFMPEWNGSHYADPELVIRWYCAYFMLPWFRNHYHGKLNANMKWFQEPFIYTDHFESHKSELAAQEWLYRSVEPVCRYYVELRYTLLQLLYDAMFENMISGLPIARALIVTDTFDEALFTDASSYLSDEYMVRNDLLVCPIMDPQHDQNGNYDNVKRDVGRRSVYLPQPDDWYVFNLRTLQGGFLGKPLTKSYDGGSTLDWDGSINNDFEHIPYITPMFVRSGGILPQIPLRQFVALPEHNDPVTPIIIHVYPGKNNVYSMYIDDGVSRDSAPKDVLFAQALKFKGALHDEEANDMYREIVITQKWVMQKDKTDSGRKLRAEQTVNVSIGKGQFPWDKVKEQVGETFKIVLWHAVDVNLSTVQVSKRPELQEIRTDGTARATVVTIPVQPADPTASIDIACQFMYSAAT